MASYDAYFDVLSRCMKGKTGESGLIQEGLRVLNARESARRLAQLGGSESQLESISRRQFDAK